MRFWADGDLAGVDTRQDSVCERGGIRMFFHILRAIAEFEHSLIDQPSCPNSPT
ncbi:hypothetical protein [Nocardia sp. NPDC050412]|uniref:hypothetical protein n=1 Tax=Nocardia sp. NPDC050412 TaxID=3364320 RepID=UPI00379D3760